MTDTLEDPFSDAPEHGYTIEVAPGVRWLQMPLPMSLNHINLYLLEDGDGWAIIDTGMKTPETQECWERIFEHELGGKPVTRVIVTHFHPDHVGMAGWLVERWQAPLYMSQIEYFQCRAFAGDSSGSMTWQSEQYYHRVGLDSEALAALQAGGWGRFGEMISPLPMSYNRLADGDVLHIGKHAWRILVGRGHSPEHACLYSEELQVILAGDQILPRITSNVSVHPTEPDNSPLSDWIESHYRFQSLVPADTFVLPAHNKPFYGVQARLQYLIEHHEDRMLAIEETCVAPQAAVDLLPVMFDRPLDPMQKMMALGECVAHLHCLMDRGRIERSLDDEGRYAFLSVDPSLAARAHPGEHDPKDHEPAMV